MGSGKGYDQAAVDDAEKAIAEEDTRDKAALDEWCQKKPKGRAANSKLAPQAATHK